VSAAERRPTAGGVYVLAGGRVWGPYGRERIDGFVAEGRVGPATPVGDHPEGPFQPAGRHPGLAALFGEAPRSERAQSQAAASVSSAAAPAGLERALVVWASLPAHRVESFEQLLGAFGPWTGLGAGLWLVRSRMGASALRNGLTRRLTQDDALLVVEAPLEQAAWFNLAGGGEPALRRLWTSGEFVS
jgi:hypothetical protein